MKEKNWTDEELAKALLKSIEYKKGITYFDDLGNCKEIKVMDIIDLITRLKCNTKLDSWKNKFLRQLQENEKLQKQVDELKEERENMQAVIFALEEEKRQAVKNTAVVVAKEILQPLYDEATCNVSETVELTTFQIEQYAEYYGVVLE